MEGKSKHDHCCVNESVRVKEIEREIRILDEVRENAGETESNGELAFRLRHHTKAKAHAVCFTRTNRDSHANDKVLGLFSVCFHKHH